MNKGAQYLVKKVNSKNYQPKNICEVGVYLPEESNILGFIRDGIPTMLVEADPNYIKRINHYFSGFSNIKVVEAAVFDFQGKVELCRRESSTFISQLESSPALINDNYIVQEDDKFIADSILFSDIDMGNIDLISIDIEGAEWYVLKHMVSRPDIISIETHGKYYTNSKINEIYSWMDDNNYAEWYINASDTVFCKKGVITVGLMDRIQLFLSKAKISLIKKKKILKTMFR